MWWHAHEMIFGFAAAGVGGFALTAVATWTKRAPVAGVPLVVLATLWMVARVLFLLPFGAGFAPAVAADLGYGVLLFALMSREVVSVRSKGNYKVLVILALLPVANALFFIGAASHAPWTFASLLSGVWLLVLLINLIGGRIIPAFTRNWMKRQVHDQQMKPATLPPQFDRFDLFATALLVVFACLQVAQAPPLATAALGALAAAALTIRLARWQGWRAFGEPLVWVLHVAFAWIPIGIALLAASELDWVPRTAGVHALTSGAITTMIVAVASRAALGHTGRPLASHPLLTASYALITIAAVLRVAATAGPGARILLMLAASAWTLGFLCFAWRYVPILTQASYIRPAQPQR
jgi:uncharacterized protein involved in response to NO